MLCHHAQHKMSKEIEEFTIPFEGTKYYIWKCSANQHPSGECQRNTGVSINGLIGHSNKDKCFI